jgi:hypothetical protein
LLGAWGVAWTWGYSHESHVDVVVELGDGFIYAVGGK